MADPARRLQFRPEGRGAVAVQLAGQQFIAALRQPAVGAFRVAGVALLLSWCVTSLFSSHFMAFNEGHMIMLFLGVLLAREADLQTARAASTASSTSS